MPRKSLVIALVLLAVFLALRLPAIHMPYHQDEWKNVALSMTTDTGTFWAHPPLFQMSFRLAGMVFGVDYFRFFPLIVNLVSAVLLYLIVRRRVGETAALWATGLYIVCFYSVLGSLQPDVDGSLVPLFFLLCVYCYDRFMENDRQTKWLSLLLVSALLGFLIKLNFILVIGAIAVDYLWHERRSLDLRRFGMLVFIAVIFAAVYIGLLFVAQKAFPSFQIANMLGHASQFSGGVSRNWIQIIVQSVKAIYYLSPLLLVPVLFINQQIFKQTRVFWIYVSLGLVFYLVAFDFSRGALDKYLMFLIIPFAVIAGAILANIFAGHRSFGEFWHSHKISILLAAFVSAVLISLNFLPHEVVGLYPKTEWFARALHGRWLMLTPMIGGSGPLGFYMSFLFIVASYALALASGIIAMFKPRLRPIASIFIVAIGVAYSGTFFEEYAFGRINGSSKSVLEKTAEYVAANSRIKSVLTYNDIGAQYLLPIGKYAGRIYALPESEAGYREKFSKFDGNYMVIDIPHLYDDGFYGRFFRACTVLYETQSVRISGRVYECPKDLALKIR